MVSRVVTVRLPRELEEELERVAKRLGVTKSELIRRGIELALREALKSRRSVDVVEIGWEGSS